MPFQHGRRDAHADRQELAIGELFGYIRGAFTGATQDKPGLFEHADGGTFLLDEIGELSPAAQAKLLRVLQDHQVRKVGSLVPRNVDVRAVAATHRNLKAMVREGQFREDLYYRLAVVEITLPPLANRREDLPLLERYLRAPGCPWSYRRGAALLERTFGSHGTSQGRRARPSR